ncbi:4-hydroxy-tetrahydrodipicolinate synthase [Cesiribacter sp. SM1]|uniref:4-hydroxy-tetrahydrodipicolinate synthase n=1 Tax=Cesiribacter sp. SM1 TaxID=2861196 RepID=UPI001CD55E69|nr:4-hydroxy-tetrahydrodipicolinate synthase [Cesiribacter sp. SM1]
MNTKFTGVGVALVTPFTAKGEVDYDALDRLLRHTAEGGVDYYVVHGTTGESVTTTVAEKAEVLRFVRENNPHKLPIMYGLGGNNTPALLKKVKEMDLEGVDAILSVSPYYNLPTQEGLYQHYKAFSEASPVPVMLYNVPTRTARNLNAETTLRLAELPNIIGVKEASGNLVQCAEIASHKPQDFLLISGDDMLTIPIISLGGKGIISVLANALPTLFQTMTRNALKGDFDTARQALFALLELNPYIYEEGNPVGVKQALKCLGICENSVRLPLVPASSKLCEKIEATVQKLKAIA